MMTSEIIRKSFSWLTSILIHGSLAFLAATASISIHAGNVQDAVSFEVVSASPPAPLPVKVAEPIQEISAPKEIPAPVVAEKLPEKKPEVEKPVVHIEKKKAVVQAKPVVVAHKKPKAAKAAKSESKLATTLPKKKTVTTDTSPVILPEPELHELPIDDESDKQDLASEDIQDPKKDELLDDEKIPELPAPAAAIPEKESLEQIEAESKPAPAPAPALPAKPAVVAAAAKPAPAPQPMPATPAKSAGLPTSTQKSGVASGNGNAVPAFGSPGTVVLDSRLRELPGNPKPEYPYAAKKRKSQGIVELRAYIDKSGKVMLAEVHRSSGDRDLDSSALATFYRWKFSPGPYGWVIKPVNFRFAN